MTEHGDRDSDPAARTQLRALFRKHGFRARRALGQTFLTDANMVRKIVSACGISPDDPVLEVGAGAGAMTQALARVGRRVVAIEVDPMLVAVLRETVSDAVEVVRADVLQVAWPEVLRDDGPGQWRLVANLPYAIIGPAILRLLEAKDWVARFTIMTQTEVAERLVSPPGSRRRGILSVLAQATCDVRLLFGVPRTCFWPTPRVDSAVLSLDVRRPPVMPPDLEPTLQRVVRAAFAARRKMLANSLAQSTEVALDKSEAQALLARCGLSPRQRAESLSVEEFLCLSQAYRAQVETAR